MGQPAAPGSCITPTNLLLSGLADGSGSKRERLEMSQRLTQMLAVLTDQLGHELASTSSSAPQKPDNEQHFE